MVVRHKEEAELVERFLRPKIAGQVLDDDVACLVRDADLYSATPDELVAGQAPALRGNWYFFSHVRYSGGRMMLRQPRHGAYWTPHRRREVVGDNGPVGSRMYFSYVVDTVDSLVDTGWVMIEYSIPHDQDDGEQLVLCKVRKSPRFQQ